MSAMVLDKSLDSIIAEKKQGKRKGGNRRPGGAHAAKAKLVGKGGAPAAAAVVAAAKRRGVGSAAPAAAKAPVGSVAYKIIVSNLPVDVNDTQVKELFVTTVGPTKSSQLQYNASGKSTGTATVVFVRAGDAQKAFDTYNNRLIDGKRPMKIEIVYDPAKQPLVNRVAAPAASTVAAAAGGGGATRGPRVRGRGRGGKGGERGGKRPPKTAEDLDAEMADYTKEATTATAA